MDALSYVMASPEARLLAGLAGFIASVLVGGSLALVVNRG